MRNLKEALNKKAQSQTSPTSLNRPVQESWVFRFLGLCLERYSAKCCTDMWKGLLDCKEKPEEPNQNEK